MTYLSLYNIAAVSQVSKDTEVYFLRGGSSTSTGSSGAHTSTEFTTIVTHIKKGSVFMPKNYEVIWGRGNVGSDLLTIPPSPG